MNDNVVDFQRHYAELIVARPDVPWLYLGLLMNPGDEEPDEWELTA